MPDPSPKAPRNLAEWMGFRDPPHWPAAPWFGVAIGWFVTLLSIGFFVGAVIATGAVIVHTIQIALSGAPEGVNLGAGALVAAILGAPFLIWRTVIAQGNLEAAREGQITDRIAKAVEQLGAERTVKRGKREETEPNVAVRIGGILALERIAQDSVRFHQGRDHVRIMELLCAYIRTNAPAEGAEDHGLDPFTQPEPGPGAAGPIKKRRDDFHTWAALLPPPRADVAAALDVIGRRNKAQLALEAAWPEQPDATTCWPFDVKPPAAPGADATEAERARHRAEMWAWKAAMTLYKGYRLDLRGTNLRRCDLSGKQLGGAALNGARLEGVLGREVNLQGALLSNAELVGCLLINSSMRYAWLGATRLEATELKKVDARELCASLTRPSIWACAIFSDVNFSGADLASGRFDHSHFNGCTFDDQTDLTHASFFGANLGGSTLPPQSLANSHGDDGTTLPDGVERPDAWKPPPPTDPTDPPPATS